MGLVDERLQRLAFNAGRGNGQLSLDAEASGQRTDADLASDGGGRRQGHVSFAGDKLKRAEEAGRVPRGKELFGIGTRAACTAQLAWGGKADRQRVVRGACFTLPAASGGRDGGIEDGFEGHGGFPV